ncbi:MAG: DUF63 family protein [Natronomonas sp.]
MALFPTGFGVPPLPYLGVLGASAVAVLWMLSRRRPPVTEKTVAALAPWMAAGGGLYALYQARAIPPNVAPFFGSPTVYLTIAIVAGFVWSVVADRSGTGWSAGTGPAILGLSGIAVLLATLLVGVLHGVGAVGWPAIALVAALVLAALGRVILVQFDYDGAGSVGLVAVFGHALDGTSTAVGFDILGFAEQTPLSRLVIETGAALPTAELVGAGWIFVLVKFLLALAIVALFEDYVREDPTEGYLLLGLVAAVGLGPGVHNLVLFAIA